MTRAGVPLRLHMLGTNLYSGGHKDEYVATFYDYKAGAISDDVFQLPNGMSTDDCKSAAPDAALAAAAAAAAAGKAPAPTFTPGALRRSFALHMPSVHWGSRDYDAFVHRCGGQMWFQRRRAQWQGGRQSASRFMIQQQRSATPSSPDPLHCRCSPLQARPEAQGRP